MIIYIYIYITYICCLFNGIRVRRKNQSHKKGKMHLNSREKEKHARIFNLIMTWTLARFKHGAEYSLTMTYNEGNIYIYND